MEYVRNNLISMHFENASEIYDYANDIMLIKNVDNRKYLNRIFNETYDGDIAREWFGLGSYRVKDALRNAVEGNKILYDHLQNMMSQINHRVDLYDNTNTVSVIKRKKVHREFGNELDIHKVYQGKLDTAWTTTQRIEVDQEHHLTTILIDVGGNADINAMRALWTAAACLKFVEVLEAAGKQVQIIIGGAASDSARPRMDMTFSVVIKQYNQHLNVERLAAMCHIGYYRAAGFTGKLASSYTLEYGLGYSQNFSLGLQNFKLPIPLHDEYKSGKTKIVLFRKALDLNSALVSIQEAQKNFSDNCSK